jgi:predicted DNA-binding protein
MKTSTERDILLGMGQASVKTSVTIPKLLDQRLREKAAELDVPMSAIVTRALDVYLKSLEDEAAQQRGGKAKP